MANKSEPVTNSADRVAELEAENTRLRTELAESRRLQELDRECLIAHMIDDLPPTEEEFLRQAREGPSFGELLVELGYKSSERSE